MRQDEEGQVSIAKEIHARFNAMKTYGKEPEALESITITMLKDLADYPKEKIMLAFKVHAQRNQEFPTTADIVGIIKRGGKPPIKESDIIAIRRKDGEDRTAAEWKMIEDWESQQSESYSEFKDDAKDQYILNENKALRQQNYDQKLEIDRLNKLVQGLKSARNIEPPKPYLANKIDKTVNYMRENGAPEEDIDAFIADSRFMELQAAIA